MDHKLRDQLRLNSVRTADVHVQAVVEVATQTALYDYDQSDGKWSKTDVEGTLMVYSRDVKPKHSITIINKNSKTNFIVPITSNCDTQLKPPYVLLRDDTLKILGIWFADKNDVPRIHKCISEFIRLEEEAAAASTGAPQSSNDSVASGVMSSNTITSNSTNNNTSSNNAEDLMSMLSKAHGEFATKHTDGSMEICPPSQMSGSALSSLSSHNVEKSMTQSRKDGHIVTDSNSSCESPQNKTVTDFFAKVCVGVGSPPSHVSGNNQDNPVLQQLFQGAAAVGGQASVVNNTNASNCANTGPVPLQKSAPISLQELEGRLRENLHVAPLSAANNKEDPQQQQLIQFNDFLSPSNSKPNFTVPQIFSPNVNKSAIDSHQQNNLLQQGQSGCVLTESIHIPQILNQSHHALQPDLRDSIHLLNNNNNNNNDSSAIQDLLTSNNNEFSTALDNNINQKNNIVQRPLLTQSQFVMALSHALTKDDFVNQLYQAYQEVVIQQKNLNC